MWWASTWIVLVAGQLSASILREHAGSQWDERVVDALVGVVETERVEVGRLAEVGRQSSPDRVLVLSCGCEDALPPEVVIEFADRSA